MSDVDALTGLPTFAGLRSALAQRTTAIFLDIDGLRFVNHDRGHLAGDDVLRRLGAWLQRQAAALRALAFRVAGDEFLILLPGRTLDEATAIAHDLVTPQDGTTLSAVVFVADPELPDRLRQALDELAEKLYQRELAGGRTHGNVVVDA